MTSIDSLGVYGIEETAAVGEITPRSLFGAWAA